MAVFDSSWWSQVRKANAGLKHPWGVPKACLVVAAGLAISYAVGVFSPSSTNLQQELIIAALGAITFLGALVDAFCRRSPNLVPLALVALAAYAVVIGYLDLSLGLTGGVLGMAVPLLVMVLFRALGREESGLGAGDVKLLGALGLFFGPNISYVLAGACLCAVAVNVALGIRAKRGRAMLQDTFPFGPYLCLATWVVLLLP